MKKLAILSLSVLIVAAMVAPLMAADLGVSGQMRIRGTYRDNINRLENTAASGSLEQSQSYWDFRLRPVFTFNINDNVKITSRVVIFNEDFGNVGTGTAAAAPTARNLNSATGTRGDIAQWDRGWATVKFGWGVLDIGRMTGGTFGHDIFDNAGAADRVKITVPMGDFTLLALTEKTNELDRDSSAASDLDNDLYAVAGLYKMENMTVGLLYAYRNNKTVAATATRAHSFNPYFVGQWGNYGLKAEAVFANGDVEIDGAADTDVSGESVWVEGTGAFGPITAMVGIFNQSGDDSAGDNDAEVGTGWGAEYTPLIILTDIDAIMNSAPVSTINGLFAVYGSLGYALNDSMTLTGLVAYAKVNEQRAAVDDELGFELDLKFKWQLMDNVTWELMAGFLETGDFQKGAAVGTAIDDTYTLRHVLQIDF